MKFICYQRLGEVTVENTKFPGPVPFQLVAVLSIFKFILLPPRKAQLTLPVQYWPSQLGIG
jgi:hypothetical protein